MNIGGRQEMSKYVRLNEGVNNKGLLVPLSDLEDPNKKQKLLGKAPNKDWYTTFYYYGEDAKKYFENNNGSIRGYKGTAKTNRLVFDFDSKKLEEAKADSIELLSRLTEEYGGEEILGSVRVCFSGKKGFHIELYTNKEFNPEELKILCKNLAGDLKTFDVRVYNITRLFRLSNTKHQDTGLFKIELEPSELWELSVEEIKEKAKTKSTEAFITEPLKDCSFLDKFKKDNTKAAYQPVVVEEDVDGVRGLNQVDFTKCPSNKPICIHALERGIMISGKGERNHIFLRLAAYYKNQGFTKEVTYNLLKGIARENKRLYPESDAYTKDEIWNTVISSVYSAGGNWKQIPGAVGTDPNNELLKKYCEVAQKHTNKKCCLHANHTKPGNKVVQIDDVSNSFMDFAENFDENIVNTGINFIDENMNITVGTTTLVVGAAGCHRKGEKVLMYDGSIKKVEDVKVGDKLMGPDSNPRNVLELKTGYDTMYKVKPTKGKPFYVNGNHILSHINSHGNWQHISINEFINRRKTKERTRSCLIRTGIKFSKKETKIDPYILGLWLGGGHSATTRFTIYDEKLIDTIKDYCEKNYFKFNKIKGSIYTYSISGNSLFLNNLRHYNLINNKHIPIQYKTGNRQQRLRLLAGLIDTDGYQGNNCLEITQKNKKLSDDIVYICRSLGFAAYTKKCIKSAQNGTKGIYYRISISGDLSEIPVKLKRKMCEKRKQIKDVLKTSFEIEKVSNRERYYGFALDKDHLYLLDDFTITHNSGKTTLALNMMEKANALSQHTMFFSLDMHKNLVYMKLATKLTNYTQDEVFEIYKKKDKEKIEEIRKAISNKYDKTYFDFSGTLSFEQMRDIIFDIERRTGNKIRLVVVDYASRIDGPHRDKYANSTHNALKSKEIADDTNAAWLIISQISRNVGDGCSPIRTKRAAKESGDWEESATNVITCWRPFMGDLEQDNVMRLFLAKNRMGPEKETVLHWNGAKGAVSDMQPWELEDYKTMREKDEKEFLKSRYFKS